MTTAAKGAAKRTQRPDTTAIWMYGALLAVCVSCWLGLVAQEVEGPYLDEYFHIRQSLVYYLNRFSDWDPKITTPPGLYLLSYPWLSLLNAFSIPGSPETHLRALNAVALLVLYRSVYTLVEAIHTERQHRTDGAQPPSDVAKDTAGRPSAAYAHTALNIALFPPLFFFSGLFYTDVVSALLVLQAHRAFYARRPGWVLVWSVASLWLRQTNVFWTGVYLAAMELRRGSEKRTFGKTPRVESGKRKAVVAEGARDGWLSVLRDAWFHGELYDPAVGGAWFEDYFKTGLSLGVAALSNLERLVVPLIPHILLIGLFVAFVFINGGVVLGDKSNHVASIHLPQMLYIWPYITFFSFPLILPSLLFSLSSLLPSSSPSPSSLPILPRLTILLPALLLTLLTIHLNTLVHPFTLADNRHYTFYVFRLLTRHPPTKYLAAPIYLFCAWACLGTLGGAPHVPVPRTAPHAAPARRAVAGPGAGVPTSAALVWILVSALSLVTAPLVEPRYFILPWVVWRVQVPLAQPGRTGNAAGASPTAERSGDVVLRFGEVWASWAPWVETTWLLLVNAGTGYMFLCRGFEWPQEKGVVMRFMW